MNNTRMDTVVLVAVSMVLLWLVAVEMLLLLVRADLAPEELLSYYIKRPLLSASLLLLCVAVYYAYRGELRHSWWMYLSSIVIAVIVLVEDLAGIFMGLGKSLSYFVPEIATLGLMAVFYCIYRCRARALLGKPLLLVPLSSVLLILASCIIMPSLKTGYLSSLLILLSLLVASYSASIYAASKVGSRLVFSLFIITGVGLLVISAAATTYFSASGGNVWGMDTITGRVVEVVTGKNETIVELLVHNTKDTRHLLVPLGTEIDKGQLVVAENISCNVSVCKASSIEKLPYPENCILTSILLASGGALILFTIIRDKLFEWIS